MLQVIRNTTKTAHKHASKLWKLQSGEWLEIYLQYYVCIFMHTYVRTYVHTNVCMHTIT